jgi:hypothetical protein
VTATFLGNIGGSDESVGESLPLRHRTKNV